MKTKKILSVLLAVVMVFSVMATLAVSVSAAKAYTLTYGSSEHGTFVVKVNTGTEIKDFNSGSMIDLNYSFTVKTTPDTGYEVDSVKINGTDATKDSENNYSFGLQTLSIPNSTLVVTFKVSQPTDECYLDLETETDYDDHKEIDQKYNLTVEEGDQTGATKVKLEWNVTDINVTRKDAKKWDTTELKWVDDEENGDLDVTAGSAEFTLTNYSDVKVGATVTFGTAEYEEGKKFTDPTLAFNEGTNTAGTDDGEITLDTANGDSTYSKTNVPTGKIAVTVTPVDSDFAKLAETEKAIFGTYTVTIERLK